jgi:hypothetical protein
LLMLFGVGSQLIRNFSGFVSLAICRSNSASKQAGCHQRKNPVSTWMDMEGRFNCSYTDMALDGIFRFKRVRQDCRWVKKYHNPQMGRILPTIYDFKSFFRSLCGSFLSSRLCRLKLGT